MAIPIAVNTTKITRAKARRTLSMVSVSFLKAFLNRWTFVIPHSLITIFNQLCSWRTPAIVDSETLCVELPHSNASYDVEKNAHSVRGEVRDLCTCGE